MSSGGENTGGNGRATGSITERNWPLAAQYNSELFWAPYRMACKMMLEAHHHALAMAEINRKLADDYLGVLRQEQDVMLDVSEKILGRLAQSDGTPDNALTSDSLNELYESAVAGLRALSQATSQAQARSMEALSEHVRATAEAAGHSMTERQSVAA